MNEIIRKWWYVFFVYFLICCFRSYTRVEGDISIYLNAAQMFLNGENIYPYYLYPPPSILLFSIIAYVDESIGRVVWTLLNFLMFLRVITLLMHFVRESFDDFLSQRIVLLVVLACSAGMIDHNIQLGQMTICMLWICLEFCYLINKGKDTIASVLLAAGILLKLLPGVFLLWLWVKKKYRSMVIVFGTIVALSILPGTINPNFNTEQLWKDWIKTVNPLGERFGIEQKATVISLNGFIPAFFAETNEIQEDENFIPPKRNLLELNKFSLELIIQFGRIVLIILLWYVFRNVESKISFKEVSLALLVCLLIFPHQMKYSMLLFVPGMIYVVMRFIEMKRPKFKIQIGLMLAFFIFAIYGRDTVGDTIVNLLDHFKYFSFLIFFALISILCDKTELSIS